MPGYFLEIKFEGSKLPKSAASPTPEQLQVEQTRIGTKLQRVLGEARSGQGPLAELVRSLTRGSAVPGKIMLCVVPNEPESMTASPRTAGAERTSFYDSASGHECLSPPGPTGWRDSFFLTDNPGMVTEDLGDGGHESDLSPSQGRSQTSPLLGALLCGTEGEGGFTSPIRPMGARKTTGRRSSTTLATGRRAVTPPPGPSRLNPGAAPRTSDDKDGGKPMILAAVATAPPPRRASVSGAVSRPDPQPHRPGTAVMPTPARVEEGSTWRPSTPTAASTTRRPTFAGESIITRPDTYKTDEGLKSWVKSVQKRAAGTSLVQRLAPTALEDVKWLVEHRKGQKRLIKEDAHQDSVWVYHVRRWFAARVIQRHFRMVRFVCCTHCREDFHDEPEPVFLYVS